jgi:hypothetical protein
VYKEKEIGAIKKLVNYIEKQNFKGYDPYDTLNSWFPFQRLGKWLAVLAIQFQKLTEESFMLSQLLQTKEARKY